MKNSDSYTQTLGSLWDARSGYLSSTLTLWPPAFGVGDTLLLEDAKEMTKVKILERSSGARSGLCRSLAVLSLPSLTPRLPLCRPTVYSPYLQAPCV